MFNAVFQVLFFIIFILLVIGCENVKESKSCDESDQPLLLTPFIENNETQKARNLSLVDNSFLEDFVPPSHAGFFTVNQTLGSHMFFWLFPSQTNSNAPLCVWLNGGPTISSMLGLFHENGPMALDKEATHGKPKYHKREHSWAGPFSMLYVDNPVNTGFSYSESGSQGDTFTEEVVSQNLYNVLEQFLLVFPEYKDLEIYIGGQSYAGMYTISLAHYIHTRVKLGLTDVDISGIYLGGPFFDPERQMPKAGEFNYHIGAFSHKTYKDYEKAMEIFFKHRKTLLKDKVPLNDIFYSFFPWSGGDNLATQERPPYMVVHSLMNTLDMKRAVHAGRHRKFQVFNVEMRDKFAGDSLTSRMEKLAVLLDNYKVLIYNGDFDSIIPTAAIEASLMQTPWALQREYNETTRYSWRGSKKRLGFYSYIGQFCRVIISGAGHQTPYDRPETTLKVMEDFVRHGCVRSRDDEHTSEVNAEDTMELLATLNNTV